MSDAASFLLAFLGLFAILAFYLWRLERTARRLERLLDERKGGSP